MSNVFRVEGYPDLTMNNVTTSFHTGLESINLTELARLFGGHTFFYSQIDKRVTKIKITLQQCKAHDEWYAV